MKVPGVFETPGVYYPIEYLTNERYFAKMGSF
jgi:hypothetical protein